MTEPTGTLTESEKNAVVNESKNLEKLQAKRYPLTHCGVVGCQGPNNISALALWSFLLRFGSQTIALGSIASHLLCKPAGERAGRAGGFAVCPCVPRLLQIGI